jgi:hypothetical protein
VKLGTPRPIDDGLLLRQFLATHSLVAHAGLATFAQSVMGKAMLAEVCEALYPLAGGAGLPGRRISGNPCRIILLAPFAVLAISLRSRFDAFRAAREDAVDGAWQQLALHAQPGEPLLFRCVPFEESPGRNTINGIADQGDLCGRNRELAILIEQRASPPTSLRTRFDRIFPLSSRRSSSRTV